MQNVFNYFNKKIDYISFEDLQNILNNNSYILINTLPSNKQECLIYNTISSIAKNNSEYIYYSKYKEIGTGSGLENSSKNGLNSGANDSKKRKSSVKKSQVEDEKVVDESPKSPKSTSFRMDQDTSNNFDRKIKNDSKLI